MTGFRLLTALYGDDAMVGIWSERATIEAWLRVESELAQAQAEVGVISQADADAISAVCRPELIDAEQLWDASRVVGYPILALTRQLSAALPPGPAGRVHYGATTQDIMDSGLALQLGAAGTRLIELTVILGDALSGLAAEHEKTVIAARTHAQQAVPTTFGAKIGGFLAELTDELADLRRVVAEVRLVSLYGAGGTNAAMGPGSPEVRRVLAGRLGLSDRDVSWHVSRHRVARFGAVCATLAATCVRFAREVVDLSRTEIAEVREQDGHHRGASSTMPQKQNPVSSESVVGFGVAAGAAAATLLRAMEAGHERSAGEWQLEWLAVPQVAEYTAAALLLTGRTATTLRVFPEVMRANLNRDGGLLMSEALMMRLAPVLGRDRAHDLVYAAAITARDSGRDLGDVIAELTRGGEIELDSAQVSAEEYVGEAPAMAAAAVADWQTRRVPDDETRRQPGSEEAQGE
ncbi:adenylosuccinate lyase [Kribbella sancticallisti]|uniref:Adenylosuccinate lyase n=1 Tax=Kribbella sancticallisti TaxID=460087 RepID=A0ABN2C0S9_9ACTN